MIDTEHLKREGAFAGPAKMTDDPKEGTLQAKLL
jgi:hypothetical protein